jgi:hypothetical protein
MSARDRIAMHYLSDGMSQRRRIERLERRHPALMAPGDAGVGRGMVGSRRPLYGNIKRS